MRASRSFTLPAAPRTPLRWIAAAFVIEAAFVAALILFRVDAGGAEPQRMLAYLLDNVPAAPRPAAPERPGRSAAPPPERPPLIAPRPDVVAVREPSDAADVQDALRPFLSDSMTGEPGRAGSGRRTLASLGPSFGDGRLWVRPTIAYEWSLSSRPIDMDSVVRQRLLAMADSMERHPAADPSRPARWIIERNGRSYGMDEHGNVHLGIITIPAPLLALIPFPQGNIDQARANARLNAMRADIMRAAARAQAEDDFRRAVQQIRERVDRERQERREQRERQQQGDRPIP